jgi:hypothetical protein
MIEEREPSYVERILAHDRREAKSDRRRTRRRVDRRQDPGLRLVDPVIDEAGATPCDSEQSTNSTDETR